MYLTTMRIGEAVVVGDVVLTLEGVQPALGNVRSNDAWCVYLSGRGNYRRKHAERAEIPEAGVRLWLAEHEPISLRSAPGRARISFSERPGVPGSHRRPRLHVDAEPSVGIHRHPRS